MALPDDQASTKLDELRKQHRLLLDDIKKYTQDCAANNVTASVKEFDTVINKLNALINDLNSLSAQTTNNDIKKNISVLRTEIQNRTLREAAQAKLACQQKAPQTTPPPNGQTVPPSGSSPTASDDAAAGTSGQTGANNNQNPGSPVGNLTPGKRPFNPLADFASSTYQLSLYAITPAAYDAFVQSGRKDITAFKNAASISDTDNVSAKAYIIAQGGGVNTEVISRAPGFKYDYFIDNLRINSFTSPRASRSEVISTTFSFNITEPMGFSLVSNLRRMSDRLKADAKISSVMNKPFKHFYILGIRFFGYDNEGNIKTGKDKDSLGNPYDPVQGPNNNIFERFYDLEIYSFKFKLDGKATVYNVQAVSKAPDAAFSVIRGTIANDFSASGTVVKTILQSLVDKLSRDQLLAVDSKKIKEPNRYRLIFATPEDEQLIGDAKLVSQFQIDAATLGLSPEQAAKVEKAISQQQTSTTAVSGPYDPNTSTFQVRQGTSIIQAINQVITNSRFLLDAMIAAYKAAPPNKDSKDYPTEITGESKPSKWYNLSSVVSNPRWDDFVGDWAYDITLVLRSYETPINTGPYSAQQQYNYPGPFKIYNYWFTGQNKEVLSFDINFENNYWLATLDPSAFGPSASQFGEPIQVFNQKNNMPQYQAAQGLEAQNNYLTFLYDPAAVALSKLTIMGDPDFLCVDSASLGYLEKSSYGPDGFSVNPMTGFMFAEIVFYEANDYNIRNGTFDINQQLFFWPYPESVRSKSRGGVILLVYKIDSLFSNGKFTQQLHVTLPTFPIDPEINFLAAEKERNEKENASKFFGPGEPTGTNAGLLPDDTTDTLRRFYNNSDTQPQSGIIVPNAENSNDDNTVAPPKIVTDQR